MVVSGIICFFFFLLSFWVCHGKKTKSVTIFCLFVHKQESTKRRAAAAAAAAADGYPSLAAHRALHDLLYPMHRLLLLHHRQGSSDPEEDQVGFLFTFVVPQKKN